MRGGNVLVCRTQSLPVKGTPIRKYRKIKPKVSFSSLPPSKIEFEAETDTTCTYVDKETLFNARVALFHTEKSGERNKKSSGDRPEAREEDKKCCKEPMNDLDSVNEMLLDIIEEIEAESVTISDFLRDAISLKVLDVEDAKKILPDFDSKNNYLSISSDLNNNDFPATIESRKTDFNSDSQEKPIDKFVDFLSTLKTEDLAKCCKFTLGKLCQLTSYEDYENVQRIAASSLSNISGIDTSSDPEYGNHIEENSIISSGYPDDSSIDICCLSSSSSESLENSSQESEREFETSFTQPKDNHRRFRDGKDCLQNVFPALIDEGVLKPRQAWEILGSENKDEMLKRFMEQVSSSCGSSAMKTYQENIESTSWVLPKRNQQNKRTRSLTDTDFCIHQSEKDLSPVAKTGGHFRRIDVFNKFRGSISTPRLFKVTSARSQHRETLPTTSTPFKSRETKDVSANYSHNLEEYGSLHSWCLENDFPKSTAQILHCRGCKTKDDLVNFESSDVQQLYELSWAVRSRLWVAIESMRLYKQYVDCKKKLDQCAIALKSMPLYDVTAL